MSPMKYPLEDLLRVRKLREDRAERELTTQRTLLRKAAEQVESARDDLERYREWRPQEEKRLFQEIREKLVRMEDLHDFRSQISLLKAQELNKERVVQEAQEALEEARQRVAEAQERYQRAVREKQKISEHKEIWLEQERKRMEWLADKELEEFMGLKRLGEQG